jgi:hypothetical protein
MGLANDFENLQVINTVRAMLTNLTDEIRIVAIQCPEGNEIVRVFFVLSGESEETKEAIEDAIFELEAQQVGRVVVYCESVVDNQEIGQIVRDDVRYVIRRSR